ncbi:hypothetical protein Q5P01_022841 [Channa striata]|uniref:Uncharacterized protein n=1 Tax=Channa striata TaxID=64152 RepID=A0AA88LRR8_CHASR|nr:hypothetical protein Q5P01_022841 [Channa striata]
MRFPVIVSKKGRAAAFPPLWSYSLAVLNTFRTDNVETAILRFRKVFNRVYAQKNAAMMDEEMTCKWGGCSSFARPSLWLRVEVSLGKILPEGQETSEWTRPLPPPSAHLLGR